MNEEKIFLGLLIIFASIGFIFLAIFIPILIVNDKYDSFIKQHSIGFRTIKELNKRYIFISVPIINYSHSYDNENFYNDISCEDYLIYQIAHNMVKVQKAINNSNTNRELFDRYRTDVKNYCKYYEFDTNELPKNKNKLETRERSLIQKEIQTPTTFVSISVSLELTQINGRHLSEKTHKYSYEEINRIIRRLRNKRNGFYLDDGIWKSLCRVERGKVTNKLRFYIYERDGYRCRLCGKRSNGRNLEIDHIIPIAKGGKSTRDNLQTLCVSCNKKKGARILYKP